MNNTLLNILLVLSCSLMAFIILLVLVAVFAFRWLERITTPNVDTLKRKFGVLRAANPTLSDEVLIRKIIQQHSFKCGVIGAITGIGGFVTLPIALPVDILMSMRIQNAMVQFIAQVYSPREPSANELRLQSVLVMSGGVRLTQTTTGLIMRGVVRVLGESLSIIIPVIGSIIGFLVNYSIAQATGTIAMRWYSTNRRTPIEASISQT